MLLKFSTYIKQKLIFHTCTEMKRKFIDTHKERKMRHMTYIKKSTSKMINADKNTDSMFNTENF